MENVSEKQNNFRFSRYVPSRYINTKEIIVIKLFEAVRSGKLETVITLVNNGVDIDAKDYLGDTPLLLAASCGHKDIVEYLIDAGADVNCVSYSDFCRYTALHYASENGWLEIAKSLLTKGADIQRRDKQNNTPLCLATVNRHINIVELFLNAGADIHCFVCSKYTMLHHASGNGWLDFVQFLLEKGASIDSKTKEGKTALQFALDCNQVETAEYLINAGADIHCFVCSIYTMLYHASKNGWLDVVQSLLENGTSIEEKSKEGRTALQIALDYNQLETAEYLINAGADIYLTYNNGSSLLSDPTGRSSDLHIKLVKLLIKKGAYFTPFDNVGILLWEHILQDIEFCSQAIINEFNHKHLPELYKHPIACSILPGMEKLQIGNNTSQVRNEVIQSVKREIKVYRFCDVFQVRPRSLKMLAVRSFLSGCGTVKTDVD